MSAAPQILAPYSFSGKSFEHTSSMVTARVKVQASRGHEVAFFDYEWLGDADEDGGAVKYPLDPHSSRHWLEMVETLSAMRSGIDWVSILEPFKVALSPGLPPLAQPGHKWRLLTAQQLATLPEPSWQIKGCFACGSLVVLYGASGMGKTFVALAMALSVAAGVPWLGLDVLPGPILYIAAEGVGGLALRVEAWRQSHAEADLTAAYFLPAAVNMLDPRSVDSLIADITEMPLPPALVVIDTMARCLVGGDENTAKDVGLFVAACDRIRATTGGTVLVVHHTTKNGESERGSSALRAAADAMIVVTNDAGLIKLTCDKQKEAPEFEPIRARLVSAGDSAFIGLDAGIAVIDRDAPLSRQEKAVLDALTAMDGATPKQLHKQSHVPERTVYVVLKSLVERGLARHSGSGRTAKYFASREVDCKLQEDCNEAAMQSAR